MTYDSLMLGGVHLSLLLFPEIQLALNLLPFMEDVKNLAFVLDFG